MQVLATSKGVIATATELSKRTFAGLLEDGTPFLGKITNPRFDGQLVGRSCMFDPVQINNAGGDAYVVALELQFKF